MHLIGQLLQEVSLFRSLSAAEHQSITTNFERIRAIVWKLIELSPDPSAYVEAWTMLTVEAQAPLAEVQAGREDAFGSLLTKVDQAVALLP